jgi:hypothetical protein
MQKLKIIIFLSVLLSTLPVINAGIVAGRSIPDGRDAGITLRMGQISSLEASVKDKSQSSGFLRQDFSLKDLGIDGGYITYGLSADKAWKFFGLQFDLLYLGISENITAQKSYNIDVDSLGFGNADYLHVQANTDIDVKFSGGIIELHGLITPISFQFSESLSVTPWVSLGGVLIGGNYDIDNGRTTAVVSYGDLSESFSVGGSASGPAGFIVPDIGFGGEVRIGGPDDLNFVLGANYSILPGDGNADWLLSDQDAVSNLIFDYSNLKINGSLEIPRGKKGKAWTIGIQYESIDASASMDLNNERFHKNIDFNMTVITGSIGMRF